MKRLVRRPLAWMIAAEVVVVSSLVGLAWHELAGATASGGGAALVLPATSTPEDTSAPNVPADALAPPASDAMPLLPGLNVSPTFWRDRLAGLNGAQAQFEALEWRIIGSAMDTIRRYVDTVLVPALIRAEKGGGA